MLSTNVWVMLLLLLTNDNGADHRNVGALVGFGDLYIHMGAYIYIYRNIFFIYDPGSAEPPLHPPMVPPRHPPPCGVVWCGVVWWWVASHLPVVWFGPVVGLLGVVFPLPPCGMAWVRVFLQWFPPAVLGLLWVFGILIPMIIMMMMGTMITIIIIIKSNILMFLFHGWSSGVFCPGA